MGQMVTTAVMNRDIPIIQAFIVIISLVIVLSDLLVDIAYGLVDPRVRITKNGSLRG
jgi:peptide/nickel transport system permease protein